MNTVSLNSALFSLKTAQITGFSLRIEVAGGYNKITGESGH